MQCARSARSTKLISKLGSSFLSLARQPAAAQWGCPPSFYMRVCGGWGRGSRLISQSTAELVRAYVRVLLWLAS